MQLFQRPPFTVTLRQKGPLGYTFKDFGTGAEVRAIKAGSQAEAAGQVVVGCTLVQIEAGGTVDHVETAPYEEVLAVLKRGDRPIKLTFKWPPFYDPQQPASPVPDMAGARPGDRAGAATPPPASQDATNMPAGLTALQQLQWKKDHIRAAKARLRAELEGLRMRDLMRRAKSEGVDEEAVLEAQDSKSPKNTMVELLLAHALSHVGTAGSAEHGAAELPAATTEVERSPGAGAKEAQVVAGAKAARQKEAADVANEKRRKKREARRAAKGDDVSASAGTIVPMLDIGIVRAVNPDLDISPAKVAAVRTAIKQGGVEIPIHGAVQVAAPGDVSDLDHASKQKALELLAQNRKKVEEIMHTVTSASPSAADDRGPKLQHGGSPVHVDERSPPARPPPAPGSAQSKSKQDAAVQDSTPKVSKTPNPKRRSQSKSPQDHKSRKSTSADSRPKSSSKHRTHADELDPRSRAVTPGDGNEAAAKAATQAAAEAAANPKAAHRRKSKSSKVRNATRNPERELEPGPEPARSPIFNRLFGGGNCAGSSAVSTRVSCNDAHALSG
eukprot:COSAG02_NODE_2442_length_8854_cov_2.621359_2_plen_557_part_00